MLGEKILVELHEYVERNISLIEFQLYETEEMISEEKHHNELDEFIKINRKPSFAQVLFSFIDKKGKKDSDIYKKAGIDRRHFSKIRSNPDYRLGKNTAIALAIALQLNKNETDQLLSAAGFSLSDSDAFDLAIQFCLEKKIYDIDHVNQALEYLRLDPLIRVIK
jgi:hypothetical protein